MATIRTCMITGQRMANLISNSSHGNRRRGYIGFREEKTKAEGNRQGMLYVNWHRQNKYTTHRGCALLPVQGSHRTGGLRLVFWGCLRWDAFWG